MAGRHQPMNGADSPAALRDAGLGALLVTWYAEVVDDYSQSFGLLREGDERYTLTGLTKDQARYALTILNHGGIDTDPDRNPDWVYELEEMVEQTTCDRCSLPMFRGEAQQDDPDGFVLCTEHQP